MCVTCMCALACTPMDMHPCLGSGGKGPGTAPSPSAWLASLGGSVCVRTSGVLSSLLRLGIRGPNWRRTQVGLLWVPPPEAGELGAPGGCGKTLSVSNPRPQLSGGQCPPQGSTMPHPGLQQHLEAGKIIPISQEKLRC